MSTQPRIVRLALSIVRAAAWLVPSRDRAGWRREWEGEIHHRDRDLGGARLLRRTLGSITDALWLFRRQFTQDNEWIGDVKHAGRQMRGRPKFYIAAALMLAAGIGSTAAGLSLLNRLVWHALPYERPSELVALWQNNLATGNEREEIAPGNFLDWQASAKSFAAIAAAEPYSVDFTQGTRPEVVNATRITPQFFRALAINPFRGRFFLETDHATGAPRVVVISHEFWQRLGADESLVGGSLRFDDTPYTVVGVLPRGTELNLFDERGERDVWLPKVIQPYETDIRGEGWWAAIARLAPGISRDQAQAEMTTIAARAAVDNPRTNAKTTVIVAPLETIVTRTMRPSLTLLSAAAMFVLLIACANVANLLLVRSAERESEFVVRRALGASRARLIRQVLAEAALLASVATTLGVVVAWASIRTVIALSPSSAQVIRDLTLDTNGVLVAIGLGAVTVLLFGLVPALQSSKGAATDSARWATASRRARTVRNAFVVSELAVAVVLATGVGLLTRSLVQAARVDPGFDSRNVGVVQVFAYDRQNGADKLRAFQSGILDRVRQIPGVVEAGTVSAMPLISANINIESPVGIEGRPPARRGEEPTGFLTVASPGYFTAMGIGIVEGRGILDTDDPKADPVVVVSRTFAERYWPNGGAVGTVVGFKFMSRVQKAKIVGIVEELRHDALELPPRDEVFIPFAQAPFGSMTFVFRVERSLDTALAGAKAAVWAVDNQQTIYDEGTVQSLVAQSLAPRRFAVTLSSAFALFALFLAGAGVYTTMSFAMAQQSREFGVKLALGASPAALGRDVLRQGLVLCGVGVFAGLIVAAAASQAIRAQLFAVSPFDPLTIAGVVAGVGLVGLAACTGPVRRAMRTDPVSALRSY